MSRQRFDVVPAIQWHEGMLLSSHHLQLVDLRAHQIMAQRLQHVLPFNYGVTILEKDEVAFGQGLLKISNLSGILPDGEIIDYDISDPNALSISLNLNDIKEQIDGPTIIWCGTPKWHSHKSPFDSLSPRFRVVPGTDVCDDYDRTSVLAIPRLAPVLSLYPGLPNPDFVSVPLFKIAYDNGRFVCQNFEPPCFYLDRSLDCYKRLLNIAMLIRQHVTQLTEKYRHQRGMPENIHTYNVLTTLNSVLPMMEHIVGNNLDHPYDIYRFLTFVIGKMAILDPARSYPLMPKYQHDNILESFAPRLDLLEHYIDSIATSFEFIKLEQKDQIFYYAPFENNGPFYVGIKFPGHVSTEDRLLWAKNVIITDGKNLEQTILARTLGYPHTIINPENYPGGFYNYDDILIQVEPPSADTTKDQKLIVLNPLDTQTPLPPSVYFAQRQDSSSKTA